jgi:glycosyltransferase involved in cell wall biosynthesis
MTSPGAPDGGAPREGRSGGPPESLVFLVQKIGPYHHARLNALAAAGEFRVTALEFRVHDPVYAWQPVQAAGTYERRVAAGTRRLRSALEEIRPALVVCVGYADPEVQAAAAWALGRGLPLVTCSDSTFEDEPRSRLKEAFKRHLLRAFDAALVAGRRSRSYLASLGMADDRCFGPWDVVDNAHFDREAKRARGTPRAAGIPERYFLCVARFVGKKNLPGLMDSYAGYLRTQPAGWDLVLSGSGPLEAELRERAASLGITSRVFFPGFLQYDALPAWYAHAGAFILPSTSDQWGLVVNEAMASGLPVLVSSRCGCAPDLVAEGRNGFTWDPADAAALTGLLERVSRLHPREREELGQRSQEMIAAFSPGSFARGLIAAIRRAQASRRNEASPLVWAQLAVLSQRARGRP